MTLIFIVENQLGLKFNQRRVSRDSILFNHIKELSKDATLWIEEYSSEIFPDAKILNECSQIQPEDFVFLEENSIYFSVEQVNCIYLYHWNRDYPSDEKLTWDFSNYQLVSTVNFEGKAHEEITEEIYERI